MNRLRCVLLIASAAASVTPSHGVTSLPEYRDAIARAIARHAANVVQLRYFGAGADTLGVAAAPISGLRLGERWVITSTYNLDIDPAAIVCRLGDGDRIDASVVARDHGRRLALLRLGPISDPVEPPRVRGRAARVGETAIALGRVVGTDVNPSIGIVSAVGRFGGRALQTDALVSPTNYGGPLLGLDGALLGVVVPLSPPGQSGVGLYDSGIGFAISPNQIAERLPSMATGRDIWPGALGARFDRSEPLSTPATVVGVRPEGPASQAGIRAKDTIVRLSTHDTPTLWELRRRLAGFDAGQTVNVVTRDAEGLEQIRSVTLGKPSSPAAGDDQSDEAPTRAKKPDATLRSHPAPIDRL